LATEIDFVYSSEKPRDIYCFLKGYDARMEAENQPKMSKSPMSNEQADE